MYKSRYKKASSRIARRNKTAKIFGLFLKISLPTIFLAGIIFLLRADFMQIKKVAVAGNKDVRAEEVEKLALASLQGKYFFLIPKSNFLLFRKGALVENIKTGFERVGEASASRNLAGVLSIHIKERQGEFVWCSATEVCYLMDKNGMIFTTALPAETWGKIIFRGNIDGNPIFAHFVQAEKMPNYLKAIETLQNANFQISEINAELGDKAVFKTDIGDIFLNPEEDMPEAALNAIILINDVKSKNPSARFQYIDARFGNKVFYKLF